jgi:transcription initiation factor IIE alpha subunit
MFKCPKCSAECELYDETNKTCMLNTELIDEAESLEMAYSNNPRGCFDEMGVQ